MGVKERKGPKSLFSLQGHDHFVKERDVFAEQGLTEKPAVAQKALVGLAKTCRGVGELCI